MQDIDRFRLLGDYPTPPFNYGDVVVSEWRGEVEIVGLTDGQVPWPVGKRASHKSFVIYAGLVGALHRESNQVICY